MVNLDAIALGFGFNETVKMMALSLQKCDMIATYRRKLLIFLNDAITFVVYIVILYYVVLRIKDPLAYDLNETIRSIAIEAEYGSPLNLMKFRDIDSFEAFERYINFTLIPSLYPETFNAPHDDDNFGLGWLVDPNLRLIGVPRFRQIRQKDAFETNKSYGPDWAIQIDSKMYTTQFRTTAAWTYRVENQTQSAVLYGKRVYGNDGFVAILGNAFIFM